MNGQPQTIAANLFERLNHFLRKDKIPVTAIASLRRDAKALKKVNAITAYTALGLIAALENQPQAVLENYRAAQHLNMGFHEYQNFHIAFWQVFDFEHGKEAMDNALTLCQLDDVEQLHASIRHASHMMRLSDAARLNEAARRIRADNIANPIIERIQQLGLPENALQQLAERVYRYLMDNKIHVQQSISYQAEDYFLVRLYVSGYANIAQLAALQDEIYVMQNQCEQETGVDLSAISFVLRPVAVLDVLEKLENYAREYLKQRQISVKERREEEEDGDLFITYTIPQMEHDAFWNLDLEMNRHLNRIAIEQNLDNQNIVFGLEQEA